MGNTLRVQRSKQAQTELAKAIFLDTYPIDYHKYMHQSLMNEDIIHQNANFLHTLDIFKYKHKLYTNTALARHYGFSDKSTENWYNGDGTPSVTFLNQIAKTEDVTISMVLGLTKIKTHTYQPIDYRQLAQYLNQYGTEHHISQRKLAVQLNCSRNTLRRLMLKPSHIKTQSLLHICDVLNCTIEDLIRA